MSRSYIPRLLTALLALAALAVSLPAGAPAGAALAPAPARVALLHAAPLAGPDAVTVAVDTAPGLPDAPLGDLGYAERLDYQDVAAGERSFKLFAGVVDAAELPAATPILTARVDLAAGRDYTLVVTGGASGFPLAIVALPDNTGSPTGASAKLRLLHAAPFAASPAATAVDIVAESGQAIPGLLDIAFGDVTDYVTLPSGLSYDLKAVPSGRPGAPAVFDLEPFSLEPGQVATLVAIGGANGRPATVVWLQVRERAPARLRVVHAAPYAGAASPVRVLLNGRLQWGGLTFGAVTEELELDEGPYTLTVEQPGDPPGFLASAEAQLRRGVGYVALIRPGVDGQGVLVTVEPEGPTAYPPPAPPRGQGWLVVHHVAPFDTGDGGRMDVRDRRGQLVAPALAQIRFGDRVLVALPAREYDLRITTPGGAELMVDVAPFTLEEGKVVSVFAVGSAAGRPTAALVIADPVQQRTHLPLVGR